MRTSPPRGCRTASGRAVCARWKRQPQGLPRPHEFEGIAHAADLSLDGRTYGWVGEVDPVAGTLVKHSLLGRFRHENVAASARGGGAAAGGLSGR